MKKKKRGRKRKITAREKIINIIKIICLVCIIILAFEVIYLVCKSSFFNTDVSYFDGTNDFLYKDDYYIAVGSNNDNDKKIEKAKIVKYNNRKEKTWEYIYNRGYNSTFLAVDSDSDNNLVAVGSYENGKNDNDDSLRAALLVKYNSDGKFLFEKDFQLLGNSKFTCIKSVSDGYIISGQSIYNDMTVGDKNGGAVLLKYDKEGEIIWKVNYGDSKFASYNSLIVKDNVIYAVGKKDNNTGVISKYDMSGHLLADALYVNSDDIGFTGVTFNDGSVVVSGSKRISDNNTAALLVKYDMDCNYVSEVSYDSDKIDRYNKVINDNDNNLVVVGTISTVINDNKSTYQGLIAKYKDNLKEISVLNYDDNIDDYFTQVKLVDGDYLVSGYSSYKDDGYLSKFITYSDALKILEVK